jgi:hypothetical protein
LAIERNVEVNTPNPEVDMNSIRKGHAVLLIAAGIAVGNITTACSSEPAATSASSKSAPSTSVAEADTMSGAYTYRNNSKGLSTTWTFTPCGPGCAEVVSAPMVGSEPASTLAGFSGQATLNRNKWTMTAERSDAATCDLDGSDVPGTSTYTWDNDNLSGIFTSFFAEAGCGDPANLTNEPTMFTLTKSSY